MNWTIGKLYFMLIFVITTIQLIQSSPIRKNDIISGKEFLSLFIDHNDDNIKLDKKSIPKINRNSQQNNNKDSDSILPIEKMFSNKRSVIKSDDTSNDAILTSVSKTHQLNNKPIEISSSLSVSTSSSSSHSGGNPTSSEQQNSDDGRNLLKNTKTDIKVIAVSVSSSIKQSNVQRIKINEDLLSTLTFATSSSSSSTTTSLPPPKTKSTTFIPVYEIVDEGEVIDDVETDKFISNSHKTDFTIDEVDPLTQSNKNSNNDDSMRSESTNIHSFLPPPNQSSHQPKSRTQRKQDPIVPYQTIIYHDNKNLDENLTNQDLRPVSYTSVSQTIGEIRSWHVHNNTSHQSLPKIYSEPAKIYSEPSKFYSEPSKIYSEPAKIYSEPAKVYGEPEKVYSQPAKIYSEPAKIYSEPAKIYSEPAKMYGEPSKVYSEPAKTYFDSIVTTTPMPSPTSGNPLSTASPPTVKPQISRRIIFNLDRLPYDLLNAPANDESSSTENYSRNIVINRHHNDKVNDKPEIFVLDANYDSQKYGDALVTSTQSPSLELYTPTPEHVYEIEEDAVNSGVSNDRQSNDVPLSTTPASDVDDSQKVGYVVEGRNYRKYRVEEKTPDGFIVGEYGVVSHNDGSLRGVRYTADSNINPQLIYDALLKFLSL